ncbi:MAG: alpha-galactosidase [Armatimonadetes bacterium]|nr:alpha-galactosidase [Armatimonadota bacterium]
MSASSPRLRFSAGHFELETPWGVAPAEVLIDGQAVAWDSAGTGRLSDWTVTATETAGAWSLAITNAGSTARRLGVVTFGRWSPAAFPQPLWTWRFTECIHGPSFSGIYAGAKQVGRKTPALDHVPVSSLFIAYQEEEGEALLLGVVPPLGQAFSELVSLHSEPHLEGSFGFEVRHRFDCLVEPGASLATSPLVALHGRRGVELMAAFGQLWGERLERLPAKPPRIGWNSWDYYSGAVTREAMDDSLAAGIELFGEDFGTLVIDEGWEQQWGSWEANGKFAGGLEEFCAAVKARGRTPGIWTAPLLVNIYNPLYLAHPEWFAARADGQVKTDSYSYGPMAYLDPTQPEVITHLERTFGRLREAGFDYFKVDFSHCILNAERFCDPRVGRAEIIRRAFAAIRRAIGDDAYLLSCGTPYESVAGLVDAARTTGDIHIYWGHLLVNGAGLATRWWMQGNLFNGDPDFLVVRGPETAEPPYGRRQVVQPMPPNGGWVSGREFNEMEARTYALLVHLSGGDVFLSDALRQLRPNALAMLRKVLRPRPQAAVPVDLFESDQDLPRIWIARGDEDTLVGLFNWSERTARLDFEPAAHGLHGPATDFWTGEPVTALPIRMPRRSSLALRYRS